jgi:quercetin dioxygenase-like cupin family protein
MELVNNINERRWVDENLEGARGYESMEIVAGEPEYTSAYSCEYVRVPPGAHSVTHVEDYNHLVFFVEGSGEITIGEETWPLSPGSYAKVKAGSEHSVRNLGDDDMLILTVYDPPRDRG